MGLDFLEGLTAPKMASSETEAVGEVATRHTRTSADGADERERTAAAVGAEDVQEIKITVRGGYSPDVIVVREGLPVRLDFYRDETASCSERVVFDDFGISRELPAFKMTSIEFTPDRAGEFTFMCGMSMMRGKLIAEPA
jgi:plastocyanin domain-containing protein